MGTGKTDTEATIKAEQLFKSHCGKVAYNNRAVVALLKELNITIWATDKTQFFRMAPILEDIKAIGHHLNWNFAMRRARLNYKTLGMAIARDSNPTVQTFFRMLHGMGLRVRVEPDPNLTIVVSNREYRRDQETGYKRNPTWTRRNAEQDGEDLEVAEARAAKLRGT